MYICERDCIKDRRYYKAGDRYLGEGDPGKHFKSDHEEEKKPVFVPETLQDMSFLEMTTPKLQNHVKTVYGDNIDTAGKSREDILAEAQSVTKARGRRKISEIIKVEE